MKYVELEKELLAQGWAQGKEMEESDEFDNHNSIATFVKVVMDKNKGTIHPITISIAVYHDPKGNTDNDRILEVYYIRQDTDDIYKREIPPQWGITAEELVYDLTSDVNLLFYNPYTDKDCGTSVEFDPKYFRIKEDKSPNGYFHAYYVC